MRKALVLLFCLCTIFISCGRKSALTSDKGTYTLEYTVTPNPSDKYLYVHLKYIPSAETDGELTLKMPVWAPGYYPIMDYPKNLADFAVRDEDGNSVSWRKEGKNAWVVSEADKPLNISIKIWVCII